MSVIKSILDTGENKDGMFSAEDYSEGWGTSPDALKTLTTTMDNYTKPPSLPGLGSLNNIGNSISDTVQSWFKQPTLEKGQVQGLSPVMQGLGAFKDIVGIYSGIKGVKSGEKAADAAMGQLNLARDSYNTAKAEQQRQVDKERKYQELLNKTYNS